VQSAEQLLGCLERGTLNRAVASTKMNAVSSRSHAVFTGVRCVSFPPLAACALAQPRVCLRSVLDAA
jgi:hypothetical protein